NRAKCSTQRPEVKNRTLRQGFAPNTTHRPAISTEQRRRTHFRIVAAMYIVATIMYIEKKAFLLALDGGDLRKRGVARNEASARPPIRLSGLWGRPRCCRN